MRSSKDSKEYLQKKAKFEKTLTLYGRIVVLEALEDRDILPKKLHMANSNKEDKNITKILKMAKQKGVEISYCDKQELSRISKNSKQDQGVALDIESQNYSSVSELAKMDSYTMIALDGIHNPQNLGMIIRSCAASKLDGIILPKKNSAKISPLVIKASAGTLFKIPIYYCDKLDSALKELDSSIYTLSSHAKMQLSELKKGSRSIFVLGNESDGVSKDVETLATHRVVIPMNRGVESLNVAVTAALIAFMAHWF